MVKLVINMRFWAHYKNSTLLLTMVLVMGCQPPTTDSNNEVETPIVINADSVAMSSEYILSVKPSRYQPSLGLQGDIEPIKQSRYITAQDVTIKKILVSKGQWVEEGTPILIVERQTLNTAIAFNGSSNNNNKNDTLDSEENEDSEHKLSNDNVITDSVNTDNNAIGKDTENTESAKKPSLTGASAHEKSNDPELITIRANFSGHVDDIYVESTQHVTANTPLFYIVNNTDLRFIATLPLKAESQLSVGQNVNFTTDGMTEKFSGQVSALKSSDQSDQLHVYVHVINNDASRGKLKPKMSVAGRVDYGQIEVGNIVPKHAIHDVDLSELQKPPYKPLLPLTANVWIIKQDQRLTRQPVEVIEYDPSTGQYLIAGINNDSLICLADLPIESAGKKVVIS